MGQLGTVVYLSTTLTVLLPELATSTFISLVPCPLFMVQSPGTVQLYSVVPPKGWTGGSLGKEKVSPASFSQASAGPVIASDRVSSSRTITVNAESGPSQPEPKVSVT